MKLKQLVNSFFIAACLSACSGSEQKEKNQDTIDTTGAVANAVEDPGAVSDNPLYGYYIGFFKAVEVNEDDMPMYLNKITISIDSIVKDMLYGHSVVAGNARPFKGKVSEKEGIYVAEVKEPGTDKYDGIFTFILTTSDNLLKGTWVANNKSIAVSKREYTLEKTSFEYNPSQELGIGFPVSVYNPDGRTEGELITEDAAKFNASLVELKSGDVENMFKRDLQIMRNTIYARHGYSFKNREMRYFFDSKVDWYIPVSTDVSKQLSALEKNNITLLKRYEDHADTYYDDFGR